VEFDHLNVAQMEKLKAALPGCTFKDISGAVMAAFAFFLHT